jgi:superfamily II DNA helicase RecQ
LQLAQITKIKPSSLAAFEKIPGVGKSRIEKYGKELIEITKEVRNSEPQT